MNFFKKLMGYALVGCLTVSVCAQAEQNYVASESDKRVVIRSTIAVGAIMAGGATLCFKADEYEHPYLMTASGLAVFGLACRLAPLILKELKKVFSKNNDEKITRSDKERWKLQNFEEIVYLREYLIPVTIAKLSSFIANPKQPTGYIEGLYQAFYDAYRNSSEYRELKKLALEKIDYEIETTSN